MIKNEIKIGNIIFTEWLKSPLSNDFYYRYFKHNIPCYGYIGFYHSNNKDPIFCYSDKLYDVEPIKKILQSLFILSNDVSVNKDQIDNILRKINNNQMLL